MGGFNMTRLEKSYQSYLKQYEEFHSRHMGMIKEKYETLADYKKVYNQAKMAGYKNNIAREIVSQQKYFRGDNVQYHNIEDLNPSVARFKAQYLKFYGQGPIPDMSDSDTRREVFLDFYNEAKEKDANVSDAEIKRRFEEYYY